MNAAEVVLYAKSRGWVFVRVGSRASHQIFRHDAYPYVVSIPNHGRKDIPKGLLATLIKQIDGTWKGPHS